MTALPALLTPGMVAAYARDRAPRMTRPAPLLLLAAVIGAGEADLPDAVRVTRLIADRCSACHGAERSDAGLRFDRRADLLLVLTPGRPERSRLLDIVQLPPGDPLVMPPAGAGRRLEPDELALLRRWIAAGAPASAPP